MEEEINTLLSRANLARVRGNLAEAQNICQTALELSPTAADAHSLLGDLFAAQEKHDEALHCYSRAVELKPDNASFREKRDKAIQVRHTRLIATQKQAPKPTGVPSEGAVGTPVEPLKRARPRWLAASLIALGGVIMLLLGIWVGTTLAGRNELVPTKEPGTVGR